MAIKVKSNGAYADIVGVFHKRAGAYEAVQGVYVKAGGVYGRVDSSVSINATASRTSGVAPLAVFFDATATTSTLTAEPWRDVLYAFDYGDSGAGTYTYGAQTGASKNRNVGGPCGGHVYETPGTYTALVWAYDGEGLSRKQFTITVQDPDVVYAGADTICVSNSGNFAGAPVGASQQAAATWQAALLLATTGKRVLLQRADAWTQSAAGGFSVGTTDAVVGSFGAGTKATITKTSAASSMRLLSTAQNIIFQDLHFAGASYNAAVFDGVTGESPDGITLHNVSTDLCGSTWLSNGTNRTDNLALHKVEITNVVGGSGNVGIFPSATNLLVIDCKVDTATSAEHCIRAPYVGKGFIYGVTAVNPANTKHAITVRAPAWAGGSVIGLPSNSYTEYVVVGNCKFSSNTAQVCTFSPQNATADERVRRCIFEGNYVFFTGSSGQDAQLVQAYDHTSRNNVLNLTGGANYGFGIKFYDSTVLSPTNNISCNDTIYRGDSCVSVTGVACSSSRQHAVKNLLLYAPSASGTNVVQSGAAVAAGNSTVAGTKTTNPLFNGTLTAIDGFRLQSGSPYKNAGVTVPLFVDGLSYQRTGTQDAGALNAVDKNTSIWGSVLPA